jgi:hypothetical protein
VYHVIAGASSLEERPHGCVPKVLTFPEITHAGLKLWLHPPGIREVRNWAACELASYQARLSSALSLLERAIKAEPAYESPCALGLASNAIGALVLRSRAVPMITKEPSVKHFVLSQVLLRPLRYFEEASLETMPSS